MRALINKADNSVSMLETGKTRLPADWQDNPTVFLVTVDDSCLEGILPEHYPVLFYDEAENLLYQHPDMLPVKSQLGKDFLVKELRRIALIPLQARSGESMAIINMATSVLGKAKVDEYLADEVLTDEEIQDILSYLNES